ncbi:MAG: KpsF/GutQ family sugar-phosphate isomerase [bacterium]|nr:MAG: KpsF/GutQ family sugar-phosphate isomerase [bacterium]
MPGKDSRGTVGLVNRKDGKRRVRRSRNAKAKKQDGDIVSLGLEVISLEIEGLEELKNCIGADFERAVRYLLECRGKVIVCGMGKSGIVARKIAATLSSTGTPAVYLHPVEATHGDMGMITGDDIVLAVSKSGGSEEVRRLLPYIRGMKVKVISITATDDSPLAQESDVVLLTRAQREACPMDIVPTTSTTAALVLGDALAVAAFRSRNFGREDFARLHPSGVLGKRLMLTVGELMHSGDDVPVVDTDTTLKDTLFEIVNKRLGCSGVTDRDGKLVGIITDGDLKRILLKNPEALSVKISKLMTRDPRTTHRDVLAIDALERMEMNKPGPITQLFVVDDTKRPIGVIHIHDIIRAGLK